jgi:hypothetical protein
MGHTAEVGQARFHGLNKSFSKFSKYQTDSNLKKYEKGTYIAPKFSKLGMCHT